MCYNGSGDFMDRGNIEKIAKNPEDRLLLSKLWDKISAGIQKNIPAATAFLSPREQELAMLLFGQQENLVFFGGFPEAERKLLVYLPEYMESSSLMEEDSPVICIYADFFAGDALTHRDILGALMGAGIARETVGDIFVEKGRALFFVTTGIAPYLLQNFSSAGKTALHLRAVALTEAEIPQPEFSELRDTVASLRLDSVLSSGFRIGRSLAAQYIAAGKAAIDGVPCEKPDKTVPEGAKISLRGMGKIQLSQVGSTTKKGRIGITIRRYQ